MGRAARLVNPDQAICAEDGDVGEQVLALTGGRGADVIVMAAASGQALQQAVRYAARRGRISLFAGLPSAEALTSLDVNLVHYRELTMVGASGSRPAQHARALDLIASGTIPVADLITHRLPIERFPEALNLLTKGQALKVTIEP